ncbi:uncharacterized protein LOC117804323 [Ailuropoda melanoleuca]|uniref:uncharacterized protein LOC117804323 n=1 Tax=Ailuropoda melanoleuca TaxID=9646 RepID=UPI0014949FFD|nr:uncharacterized protein LOC117804323 [Ailuropoda melanoleuca]
MPESSEPVELWRGPRGSEDGGGGRFRSGAGVSNLFVSQIWAECGSALRSLGAARAPRLRARLGLRSPRVPSSFARPELRCFRRPERRGKAVLGGPAGGRPSSSRGRARHRHSAERPGGFPAPRPGRPNNLALCSPRAPPPRLCSGFGAGRLAAAQTPPGPTRHPGSVSPTCAGLPRPELYAQILFIYLTERRERASGVAREAGSPLSREPSVGLDPGTLEL